MHLKSPSLITQHALGYKGSLLKLNVFFLGSHTVSTCFIFTHFQNRSFERSKRSVFTRNEKSEEG